MKKLVLLGVAVAIVSAGGSATARRRRSSPAFVTAHCIARGALPDPACTPGAVFPNVTADDVCRPGHSKSVRSVSKSTKRAVFAEYGVTVHTGQTHEVDHYISLELGGSNDLANLWPEPAEPTPGFHQKDKVENWLHREVCHGRLSLKDAQRMIATDWLAVYRRVYGK